MKKLSNTGTKFKKSVYSFVPNCRGEGGRRKCTRWKIMFLGHSLIIIKWTWGFFSPKFAIWPAPTTHPPPLHFHPLTINHKSKSTTKKSSVEVSLLSQYFGHIYSSHISHWTQSPHFSVSFIQRILQTLQVVPSSSSSSLSSSFYDSGKLLYSRYGPDCSSSWGISSLATVPDGIFFLLPLSTHLFLPYFMSVSFVKTFALSWEIVFRSFLNFFPDSMNNSYCKKITIKLK